MTSMIDLQIALLEDNKTGVREILNDIDRRSENDMFRKAGEYFGFKTAEANGLRVAYRGELARVFGYADESGLRKLTENYGLQSYPIGAWEQNVRTLIVTQLELSKYTSKAVFDNWQTFLLASMKGTSEAARQVNLYLLHMEKAGRVAGATLDIAKGRHMRIGEAGKVVMMVSRAERIKSKTLRTNVLRYVDDVLDGALKLPGQGDLFGEEEA